MQKYFDLESVHSEGNCDLTISASGLLYSVGEDKLLFRKNLATMQEQRLQLTSFNGTCSAISSTKYNNQDIVVAAFGSKVFLFSKMDKEQIEVLCEFQFQITQIVFSKSGKYLGIGSADGEVGVFDVEGSMMRKCEKKHSSRVLGVFFSHDQRLFCSTGNDGYLRVFDISDVSVECPQLKLETNLLKTSDTQNDHQILSATFNPQDTLIACPGRSYLQIISYTDKRFQESSKTSISHQKEIFLCHWVNSEFLLTVGFDVVIKIWNFRKESLVLKIEEAYLTRVVSYDQTFFGINHSGSIHRFKKPEMLRDTKQKENKLVQSVPKSGRKQSQNIECESQGKASSRNFGQSQNQEENSEQEQGKIDQVQSQNSDVLREIIKFKSKASKLITCFPQQPLQKGTDFFTNARFLCYNTVGCIIEKVDGTSNTIEVEYHDASVVNQRKSIFIDREMLFFDVGVNRVAYANKKEYGFFGDCFWEHKVEEEDGDQEIQGVALGNEWMAVALKQSIMIFDLAGNFTSSISFSKKFVAMTAYEDTLVLAYIDSIPVYGCQNLRMNIWNINGVREAIENVCISVRPSSTLKAFGFSSQGLLYCQDSKENVRVFNMNQRKWVDIFNPRNSEQTAIYKYWIIGISNFELLAFRLSSGQYEPTVFPRPHPRKLKISLPNPHKKLAAEELPSNYQLSFAEALWKKFILQHQRYRFRTWYRYKFARTEQNANYHLSTSILGEEELNIKDGRLDEEMMMLVKTLVMEREGERAYVTARTFVRSERELKKLMELLMEAEFGEYAEKLQEHYDEVARLQQFDLTYKLKLRGLQDSIEQGIGSEKVEATNPRQSKRRSEEAVRESSQQQNKNIRQNYNPKQTETRMDKSVSGSKITHHEIPQDIPQPQTQTETQEVRNPFLRTSDPIQHLKQLQGQIEKRKMSAITKNQDKAKNKNIVSQTQPTRK